MPTDPDFNAVNEGNIALPYPNSEAATAWVEEHLPEDTMRWGAALVVEHRYIMPILEGIEADGLAVAYSRPSY